MSGLSMPMPKALVATIICVRAGHEIFLRFHAHRIAHAGMISRHAQALSLQLHRATCSTALRVDA